MQSEWLSKEEVVYHRMLTFHRERVEAIASNRQTLFKHGRGIVVVHLIPEICVKGRNRISDSTLKQNGGNIRPFGADGGDTPRFNIDGLLNSDGRDELRAYSQVYRDGRVEAVMSDAAYPIGRDSESKAFALRSIICERGVFALVRSYFEFCKAAGISTSVWMFTALLDCEGVRLRTDRSWSEYSRYSIDRSPAYLPEIEITDFDGNVESLLRPWCDFLWQSVGIDRSPNFSEQGNWSEPH